MLVLFEGKKDTRNLLKTGVACDLGFRCTLVCVTLNNDKLLNHSLYLCVCPLHLISWLMSIIVMGKWVTAYQEASAGYMKPLYKPFFPFQNSYIKVCILSFMML